MIFFTFSGIDSGLLFMPVPGVAKVDKTFYQPKDKIKCNFTSQLISVSIHQSIQFTVRTEMKQTHKVLQNHTDPLCNLPHALWRMVHRLGSFKYPKTQVNTNLVNTLLA